MVKNEEMVSSQLELLEKARQAIAVDLFPTLPDGIEEVRTCEVAYRVHPTALPYAYIAFPEWNRLLASVYNLKFQMPDNLSAIAPHLRDQSFDPDRIGAMLMAQASLVIQFKDGLFRLSDGRALPIEKMLFTSELVNVSVRGTTRAAEHIISELIPLMWAIAGVKKEWTELQKQVQIVQYGSSTLVRFPERGLRFLSDQFLSVIDKWILHEGIASRMGSRSSVNDWQPPSDTTSSFFLDELHLIFERHAPVGLGTDTTRLRIGVNAKHLRGTGVFSVDSELPLSEHLSAVEDLIGVFK